MNLSLSHLRGLLFLWVLFLASAVRGQVCECLNCPQPLPPAGLDTCYYREFVLNIKGAENDDLADPFQGICALRVHFRHNYVWSQEMWLITPGGDTLALTGPAMTSGYASSALSSWDITFLPSVYPANPDPGFNDTWSNDQLWEVFRKYTGQYYPAGGPLQSLNKGPVNGQWRILLKNCTEIESGQFINFSIVFCDETGIDCSCQAYAGTLAEESPWHRCVGDPSLDLDLTPFYQVTPPDTALYAYTFALAENGIFTGYSDQIDLRTAPAGVYDICGISYALEDQDSLLMPDGILTIPLLRDSLFSSEPPYCGDISGNCLRIFIGEPLPVQVIDTVLCAGKCISLGDSTYCASVLARDTFPAFNGCDSIVELRLTVLPPAQTFLRDTICSGEFYNVGTNFYSQSGVYTNLLVNPVTGCDSLVILDLEVLSLDAQAVAPGLLGCLSPTISLNGLGSGFSIPDPEIRWEAGPGGNIISGANTLLAFADQPGTYSLILSKSLSGGKVCADTAVVQVLADPATPDLQGPSVFAVCQGNLLTPGQLPVQDAGNLGGTLRYYSGMPFDPSNQVAGTFSPSSGDSIYAYYVFGACADTLLMHFESVEAPFVELRHGIKVCNDDAGGLYNTWILFDTLVVNANVVGGWSNTGGAPVSGIFPLVNFAGAPGPASYTFTWSSVNATPPCPNIQRTLEIFVENCACPSVATLPPGVLCQNSANLWLPELEASGEPGTWSIVSQPSGNAPALIDGDSLLVSGRDTGMYRIVFRLDTPPPAGCPDSSAHWFSIVAAPMATVLERDTVCNEVGSAVSPTELVLADLILDGDRDGNWLDLSGSGALLLGDTALFAGVPPGNYPFLYTTSTGSPCPPTQYLAEITVLDCACPPLAVVAADTLCNDAGSRPLGAYVLEGGSGQWSVLSAPPGVNPAILSGETLQVSGADPGEYLLLFQLSGGPVGTCPDRDTLSLTLVQGVSAQVRAADTLCNDPLATAYPVILDFTSLVTGGFTGGQWLQIGQSGASGALPILNFTGVNPGDYDFLYLTSGAQPPCLNRNYPVRITVRDCACPVFRDTVLCNADPYFDLESLHDYDGPVTWTLVSTPQGNSPAGLSGGQLVTGEADPGLYLLEATWQNPPGRICPETAQIRVELVGSAPVQLRSPVMVCNGDSPFGPRTLLFDTLVLSGGGNGTWQDLDASDASGSLPLLDFSGVLPGTYRFRYERPADGPCPARGDTLEVEVLDCSCPPLQLAPLAPVCEDAGPLDLAPSAIGLPAGSWEIGTAPAGNNPAILAGTTLALADRDPGEYRLIYRLSAPWPGCPDTVGLPLHLDRKPRAGSFPDTLERCPFQPEVIQLAGLLDGADPGGVWQFDPTNPYALAGLDAQNGSWTDPGMPGSGTYRIQYILPPTGACAGDSAFLVVEALPARRAEAGPDLLVACGDWPVWIGEPGAPEGAPWQYAWSLQGTAVGLTPRIAVDLPGLYLVSVTHQGSLCSTMDSVLVEESGSIPVITNLSLNLPSCNGLEGAITVGPVSGGVSPYLYRINGQAWQAGPVFQGLGGGVYLLEIEDALGCRTDTLMELPASGQFSVDLGGDIAVTIGGNVTLEAQLSGTAGVITEVRWEPMGISCPDCLTRTLSPQEDVLVTVTVTNLEGCVATDAVWVRVLAEPLRLFIPNAISPNQDGINDLFTVYGNELLDQVLVLRIHDRWGNLLFERREFPPNAAEWGWDGTFRGKPLEPGVYIYSAELRLRSGATRVIKGDVSVLR